MAPKVNQQVFVQDWDAIDRDGIFFIEHADFVKAFYSLAVGHYKEGYLPKSLSVKLQPS
jgi:hypothetical protein